MQHGPCDQCLHYRPKRRLDRLFKIPTNKPSPASGDIREREAQWESDESECLLDLLDSGVREWPGRPHVLAYCGLHEEEDVFLVYESKNVNHESKHADHRCDDFTPSTGVPLRFCSTCVHRDEARGPGQDRESAETLLDINRGMGAYDSQNHTYDSGWTRIRQSMESRSEGLDAEKTTNMQMALDCGGVMPTPPLYYDTCRKYSRTGNYVLCPVRNYHGRCPGHSSSARAAATESSRARSWEDGGSF